MQFIAGIIVGILVCVFLELVVRFFRHPIESTLKRWEADIERVAPKQKGFIVMPKDEADEARELALKKNQSEGRDTKLEDLR
jgi:hypothetical protein